MRHVVDQHSSLSGRQVMGLLKLRVELLHDDLLHRFAIKPTIEHGDASSTQFLGDSSLLKKVSDILRLPSMSPTYARYPRSS